jgi:hypothetical protein
MSSQLPAIGLHHEVHYWVVWVYTKARTVLITVIKNLFCNCWCLEIPLDNHIRHTAGGVLNREQILNWGHPRISMFEVAAVLTVLIHRSRLVRILLCI